MWIKSESPWHRHHLYPRLISYIVCGCVIMLKGDNLECVVYFELILAHSNDRNMNAGK